MLAKLHWYKQGVLAFPRSAIPLPDCWSRRFLHLDDEAIYGLSVDMMRFAILTHDCSEACLDRMCIHGRCFWTCSRCPWQEWDRESSDSDLMGSNGDVSSESDKEEEEKAENEENRKRPRFSSLAENGENRKRLCLGKQANVTEVLQIVKAVQLNDENVEDRLLAQTWPRPWKLAMLAMMKKADWQALCNDQKFSRLER